MSLIQEHFSVFMDFSWHEDHLLRVMCNLRKIYHRHGESDHHSNTLLQSTTKYSLCIKHNTNCANFYVWLLDKLQTVNNKMDRVVTSSRRFELQGQYHVWTKYKSLPIYRYYLYACHRPSYALHVTLTKNKS